MAVLTAEIVLWIKFNTIDSLETFKRNSLAIQERLLVTSLTFEHTGYPNQDLIALE